ncbi:MAG: FMN-binding protein [Gammaproteobacteria bacterium]|nr:FMN-binding protein [Gammaproteobacteria bacterium]
MQMRTIIACILISAATGLAASTDQVYQTRAAFIRENFADQAPPASTLWLNPQLRAELKAVLGRSPSLRMRYWERSGRTLWILNEIGKVRPITTGVVVANDKIESIRVLVFRESRGWEVRYDFFTNQFVDARLNEQDQFTQPIDGITGATLSVRAMKRMAKAALILHEHATETQDLLAKAN